jgi:hypothetical protein
MRCFAALSFVAVCTARSAANGWLPPCDSTRPQGGVRYDFRNLNIPRDMMNGTTEEDIKHANKLCCVYTRIELVDQDVVKMITYDGSERTYSASTFSEAATMAYSDICGMSMGSVDCETQRSCIADADADAESSALDSSRAMRMWIFGLLFSVL